MKHTAFTLFLTLHDVLPVYQRIEHERKFVLK